MDTPTVKPKRSGARGKLAWGTGIIGTIVIGLIVIDLITDRIATQQVSQLVEEYNNSELAELSYESVGSSLFGGTVTVSEITLETFGSTLNAGELILYEYELTEEGMPVMLNARLRDITIDPETLFPPIFQNHPFVQTLAQMGYTEPTKAEFHVNWRFHPEESLTDLRKVSLSITDLGSIDLESEFIGLSTGAVARLMLGMESTIPLQISSLKFEYQDDSFVSRLLQYVATQRRKESVHALVDELVVAWERDQGLQVVVADELEQFLRNPRSLRFSINPKYPVTMPQIGAANSPEELAELLRLNFDTN